VFRFGSTCWIPAQHRLIIGVEMFSLGVLTQTTAPNCSKRINFYVNQRTAGSRAALDTAAYQEGAAA